MAINPFKSVVRSQILPSSSFTPFVMSNGKIMADNMVDASSALKNADIFAAVNLLSSDFATCKWRVNEPFNSLLNQPSELINGFSFWQSIMAQLLLAGNAYVHISRDKQAVPVSLEELPVSNVTVVLGDDAKDITYQVTYNDERNDAPFKSDDVLHFRLLPTGMNNYQYIGMSPLEALQNEVNIQNYANRLSLGTLKNAISPTITLTVPEGKLDKEAKDNIRDSWEDQNGGDNNGRVLILDQGLKLDTIQINADVAKFLNDLDWTKAQIAKVFGIPDEYLNGKGNEQSSSDQAKSLYANALQRYITPVLSELTMKLGVEVRLDVWPAIDVDNSQFINMLKNFSTGTTQVFNPDEVKSLMQERGIIS